MPLRAMRLSSVVVGAMANRVEVVLGDSPPREVDRRRVEPIPIEMPTLGADRARAVPDFADDPVNPDMGDESLDAQIHHGIALIEALTEDAAVNRIRPFLTANDTRQRSHLT